ncbi:MAG: sulfurtransferase complex subunit TusD [Glaciecola sp.]
MASSFVLMVTKSPFDARNSSNAIAFCQAAISSGHTIEQVFFYQSGVQNASTLSCASSSELDIYNQWLALHTQHGVSLNVCSTAGIRRGIVGEEDASRLALTANVAPHFSSVGLSDYFAALASQAISIQL